MNKIEEKNAVFFFFSAHAQLYNRVGPSGRRRRMIDMILDVEEEEDEDDDDDDDEEEEEELRTLLHKD